MYYDFYCNEKMLLNHYEDNPNGNRMLRRLVAQTGLPPDQCADMYLQKMDNSKGLFYDRYDVIQDFEKRRTSENVLLDLKTIPIYEQDVRYIKEGASKYHMQQREMLVLFGAIVMCRILQTDVLDLTTSFKLKQFCSCFDGKVWKVRVDTGRWTDIYHAPSFMEKVSDKYGLLYRTPGECGPDKIGCYYAYPNYTLESQEIVYEHVITPHTNRLNFCDIFKEVGLEDLHYCTACGAPYYKKVNNRPYCDDCLEKIKRQKTRERVKKYRRKTKM